MREIRLVEHRELGVATSTKQRHPRDDMICKDIMSEKVKNKNLKLKMIKLLIKLLRKLMLKAAIKSMES